MVLATLPGFDFSMLFAEMKDCVANAFLTTGVDILTRLKPFTPRNVAAKYESTVSSDVMSSAFVMKTSATLFYTQQLLVVGVECYQGTSLTPGASSRIITKTSAP